MTKSTAYTYLGTADDVVLRYPWKNGTTKTDIEDQLIFSAIYDNKLAINDGYIVANKILLPSLINTDKSLLANLLESESAVLFSRSEPTNIAQGIENSAKIIETHRQIVENDKIWPVVCDNLNSLQKVIKDSTIKWPDLNMGAIFYKTFESLFINGRYKKSIPDNLQIDFEKIFNNFSKKINDDFDGARDLWESLVWRYFYPKEFRSKKFNPFSETLSERKWYPQIKILMQAANEAYHIAYTCALDKSLSINEGNTIVKPMTALCPAYQNLFKKEVIETNDCSHFNYICKYSIPIYSEMFEENADFRWISSLKRDSNLRLLRMSYLNEFNKFIKNPTNEKELKEVRDEYLFSIYTECKGQLKKTYVQKDGLNLIKSLVYIIPSVAAITASMDPLAVAGIGFYLSKRVKCIQKYVDFHLVKRNKNLQIQNILRDSGLVNAPLNSDAVAKHLEGIKPYGKLQDI